MTSLFWSRSSLSRMLVVSPARFTARWVMAGPCKHDVPLCWIPLDLMYIYKAANALNLRSRPVLCWDCENGHGFARCSLSQSGSVCIEVIDIGPADISSCSFSSLANAFPACTSILCVEVAFAVLVYATLAVAANCGPRLGVWSEPLPFNFWRDGLLSSCPRRSPELHGLAPCRLPS